MAFGHGSVAKVYANGYDLTPYLTSFGVAGAADTAEVTVLGQGSKAYLAGLKDATLSGEGYYDGDAGAVDAVLRAALGTDTGVWGHLPNGDGVGVAGYGFRSVETAYEVSTPVDGVAGVSVEAQSNVGLEPLVALHELKAETAAGQGTSHNNGAASTNGGSAYLQLVAGTTVTVTVKDSADGTTFATIGTFTAASGHSAQRIAITGTIRQYTRVEWDKACTFWAGIHRE